MVTSFKSLTVNLGLLVFLLGLPLVLSFFDFEGSHSTDDDLIRAFQNDRAGYQELADMILADDKLTRVSSGFTRPENPEDADISEKRIEEYIKLFRRLELPKGIEKTTNGEIVWFSHSSKGISVSGSGKGIAYLRNSPDLVVDNLDSYLPKDNRSFRAFRKIDQNWYLFLVYED